MRVHVDRDDRDRRADLAERQQDAELVPNGGGVAERRIEAFGLETTHEVEGDLAGDRELEVAAGERAGHRGAAVDGERRDAVQEEVLEVVVRGDDDDVGLEASRSAPSRAIAAPNPFDLVVVLGVRQREELRGVRNSGPADDAETASGQAFCIVGIPISMLLATGPSLTAGVGVRHQRHAAAPRRRAGASSLRDVLRPGHRR